MFENENNKIRFAYPKGDTLGEIKENARRMNLNDMGDMHLVLANEGDLCLYGELIDGSKEDVKDLNSFNNIDLSDFEFPPLPDPNTVDLSLPSGSAAETILRKHV